ncbi:uncharacterized protein LOC130836153 isoform X2 [Hippopotamus amphibius kiboko]|uniref:uncharacterized protein LOC130836153 isoform X2 n=1 Tax=Hippopotamus amphibius kiboko TaxID=575201 RepID=UPI00259891AB|nr:uncharacterized protein LOC130836153 isoform X2 [Hippopotamus amphibius kiboko]
MAGPQRARGGIAAAPHAPGGTPARPLREGLLATGVKGLSSKWGSPPQGTPPPACGPRAPDRPARRGLCAGSGVEEEEEEEEEEEGRCRLTAPRPSPDLPARPDRLTAAERETFMRRLPYARRSTRSTDPNDKLPTSPPYTLDRQVRSCFLSTCQVPYWRDTCHLLVHSRITGNA